MEAIAAWSTQMDLILVGPLVLREYKERAAAIPAVPAVSQQI